jgi:hypothetical protein
LLHPSRIRLSARFHEFGDRLIEINDELWAEVLPVLMDIDVSIGDSEDMQEGIGAASTPVVVPITNIGMSVRSTAFILINQVK